MCREAEKYQQSSTNIRKSSGFRNLALAREMNHEEESMVERLSPCRSCQRGQQIALRSMPCTRRQRKLQSHFG